jgi:hypothetical protein
VRHFDLDLVGVAIAAGLAPTLGRKTATMIVSGFFNQWVAAVGPDADTDRRYFFAIGAICWDEAEKRPREIFVTNGNSEQIMSDLRDASAVM